MLAKKILGAMPHRPHRVLNIPLARQKDDGQRVLLFRHGILDFEPAQARHLQIEDQAARADRGQYFEKLGW